MSPSTREFCTALRHDDDDALERGQLTGLVGWTTCGGGCGRADVEMALARRLDVLLDPASADAKDPVLAASWDEIVDASRSRWTGLCGRARVVPASRALTILAPHPARLFPLFFSLQPTARPANGRPVPRSPGACIRAFYNRGRARSCSPTHPIRLPPTPS